MCQTYQKSYIGVCDVMTLFNVGYIKARKIVSDATKLHSKNYSRLENQVLLEKVLEVQGITNISLWIQQQECRFPVSEDIL